MLASPSVYLTHDQIHDLASQITAGVCRRGMGVQPALIYQAVSDALNRSTVANPARHLMEEVRTQYAVQKVGANQIVPESEAYRDPESRYPLQLAAFHARMDMLKVLIKTDLMPIDGTWNIEFLVRASVDGITVAAGPGAQHLPPEHRVVEVFSYRQK